MGPPAGVTVISGVVTVNGLVAATPPTSVAKTVVPDVPLGTGNVQLNDPGGVPTVVNEPLVQLVIGFASKARDVGVVDTEKPVPATVTVAPMGPWPGVTVIVGVVTVNIAVAMYEPPSVAMNVYGPAGVVAGILNVQLNAPPGVWVVPAQAVPEPHDTVTIEPAQPVPLKVVDAPGGP